MAIIPNRNEKSSRGSRDSSYWYKRVRLQSVSNLPERLKETGKQISEVA